MFLCMTVLYPSVCSNTKQQIAALLATSDSHIYLDVVNCKIQKAGNDCGLFAVAFATTLASNLHPERYVFNQGEMRQHLANCLVSGRMTVFPAIQRKVVNQVKARDEISVFCSCRLPEILLMIECSKWYHTDCVSVSNDAFNNAHVDWFCNKCHGS